MSRSRVLVLVLAGGAGGRLELLTRDRAKPAVPFAGTHRLIDFPLSNARNSGVDDVWVVQQHQPASLTEHLANGRAWDLDRTQGGLRILHPAAGQGARAGFHEGTADALWRVAPLIRQHAPEVLVIVSADAVYALDYAELAGEHVASGASLTMVTTRVDPEDAGRYGVVRVEDGRVAEYAYKPDDPASDLVANEVFACTPGRVLDLVDELAEAAGDDGLSDLGDELLPRLVEAREVREHRLAGYWRDVGTVDAYWEAHQELLEPEPPFDLDDQAWPIASSPAIYRAPARVVPGAAVERGLLGAGAHVAGTVRDSVLAPGAVVEEGAEVLASVLLPGAVVRAGARVVRAVVDDGVEVGRDARVGEEGGAITLLGARARVEDGAVLAAGARFPDEEDEG